MRKTMIAPSLLAALLSAPLAAQAQAQDQYCKHSEPRQLALDLAGAKAVVFDIGPNELRVESRPGAVAGVQGKACASQADVLPQLRLTQEKVGDKLVVRAHREGRFSGIFFSSNYAYQRLTASVPDTVPVQLKVGSGDAWASGAPVLSVDVGSGDAEVRDIKGLVAASVGSGDIDVHDAGALKVISIGSGDVEARQVRGNVEVGSIGSGDFDLVGAGGDVEIGSIGSGDATLRDVAGNVRVGSVGSGEVEARGVGGGLTVRSVGSGEVVHEGVRGALDIPKRK